MSAQPQTPLKHKTVCRVPGCGQEFLKSPLDIPIVGQPNRQVVEFVTALAAHVQKKHPDLMNQLAASAQEWMGYLTVALFNIEDPSLLRMREHVRARMQLYTRKTTISDAEIQDRVARIGLDSEQEEGVNLLLRDMRDILTESGKYSPQLGEEAKIVTPIR
jgi:hypothetical protein